MPILEAKSQAVSAVIDVRAYAAGTSPSKDWFDGRAAPAFADRDAQVAAIALRGSGRVEALATDEFVLVLEGRLDIKQDGGPLTVAAGTGAVLPLGSSFGWCASDDLLAVIYSAPTATPGNAAEPLAIDLDAPLAPSNPPLAENLIGTTPSCRSRSDYVSANGEFACGVWDSTPYHRRQIPYRQVELMYLLAGKVSFYDAHGSVSFSAGAVCLFVRGDGCAWLSEEYVRKIYATQRPVG